eukprot:3208040-Amphidinium_carterae.1
MVPALNAIGIEIACFGNHDFDHGLEELQLLSKERHMTCTNSRLEASEAKPLRSMNVRKRMVSKYPQQGCNFQFFYSVMSDFIGALEDDLIRKSGLWLPR